MPGDRLLQLCQSNRRRTRSGTGRTTPATVSKGGERLRSDPRFKGESSAPVCLLSTAHPVHIVHWVHSVYSVHPALTVHSHCGHSAAPVKKNKITNQRTARISAARTPRFLVLAFLEVLMIWTSLKPAFKNSICRAPPSLAPTIQANQLSGLLISASGKGCFSINSAA